MPIWNQMMPGLGAVRTASHRTIFLQRSESFLAGGKLVDGTRSRDPGNTPDIGNLRIGLLLGKVTSGGLYAPAILGVTSGATAAGAVAVTAAAAVVTELVRRLGASGTFKLTGPPAANGVVVTETVTYSAASGTTITCTATANAFVAGSFIQPVDGSETPLTFIPDTQGYGLYILDEDGISAAVVELPRFPVSGIVDQTQLLPAWPSDTSLQAWLINRLNDAFGGQFVFNLY